VKRSYCLHKPRRPSRQEGIAKEQLEGRGKIFNVAKREIVPRHSAQEECAIQKRAGKEGKDGVMDNDHGKTVLVGCRARGDELTGKGRRTLWVKGRGQGLRREWFLFGKEKKGGAGLRVFINVPWRQRV